MAQIIAAFQTSASYVFFSVLTLITVGLMFLVWIVNSSLVPSLIPHFALTITVLIVTKLHYYQKDKN